MKKGASKKGLDLIKTEGRTGREVKGRRVPFFKKRELVKKGPNFTKLEGKREGSKREEGKGGKRAKGPFFRKKGSW